MSNVTAALECPACEEILEAEERPNINWKLGTTRVVVVPTGAAIEHIFTCPAILAGLEEAAAYSPSKVLMDSMTTGAAIIKQGIIDGAEGIEVLIAANPSLGASPDAAIFAEAAALAETDPAEATPVAEDPAAEPDEKPDEKPAPKKRSTK